MGEQTCTVLVGFVMVHVALILCVISIGTPVWIKAYENGTESDENVTTKGLWQICEFGDCERFNQSAQTGSFLATQVLFSLASCLLFVGTLGMYVYLASHVLRMSKPVAVMSTLNIALAYIFFLCAVIVFAKNTVGETADLGRDMVLKLGWSYYTAVAATVFSFFSVLAAMKRTQILMSRTAGYEDL